MLPLRIGQVTPAFGLRAKAIVHVVGSIWQGGGHGEADLLRSTYDAALECATSQALYAFDQPII